MSARFRIRTSGGQELSFASQEVFSEFVRSGDLSPDDVVYDAETKEWSSARTHPVVLQIEMEDEEARAAAPPAPAFAAPISAESEPDDPGGLEPPSPPPGLTMDDIGLELAPAQEQLTPEQEAAAFVAKMEAERASDLSMQAEPQTGIHGFTMEHGALPTETVEPPPMAPMAPVAPPVRPTPAAPRPAPVPTYREEPPEEPRRRESTFEPEPSRAEPEPEPKRRQGPSVVRKYAPFAFLILVIGGAAVYIGPELFSPTTAGSDTPDAAPPPPPAAAGSIPATEEAVRGRARERFLTGTQAMLRGLPAIPEVWLRGQYLAAPSDYAAVRQVWETYLATIRDVRSSENQRYADAYGRALDDARVTGGEREQRLASGTAAFRNSAGPRERHYDRVESLATVAIRAHDALVDGEGQILYEPASSPRVSGDPVIEAVGRGREGQELLEEVLDAILGELQAPGGPQTRENVREWVYGGILAAVAN